MDLQPVPVGEREDFEQAHRVLLKKIVDGERKPAAVEHEAVELAGPAAQRRQEAPAALRHLLVEMREEGAGQVADALRVEKLELHEALDRALADRKSVVEGKGVS